MFTFCMFMAGMAVGAVAGNTTMRNWVKDFVMARINAMRQ